MPLCAQKSVPVSEYLIPMPLFVALVQAPVQMRPRTRTQKLPVDCKTRSSFLAELMRSLRKHSAGFSFLGYRNEAGQVRSLPALTLCPSPAGKLTGGYLDSFFFGLRYSNEVPPSEFVYCRAITFQNQCSLDPKMEMGIRR